MGQRARILVIAVAAVLAVGGAVLVLTWRPSEDTVTLQGDSAHYGVQVVLDAARTGQRAVDVRITPHAGAGDPDQVAVEPAMPAHSHAVEPLAVRPAGAGHFHADGSLFLMPGQWELTVSVTTAGHRDQITFPLSVNN
ncbi:FixH family protein [Kutzneria viridogrisea]|uniref:YtkA-like domain-containing protein n=1 Tax=Kutzneria viridogrisea TaxID=47990 RepID=A0ABR6BKR9_9PSEU|nr:hypothetical protein [Kutzneria viridogrisea]